MDFGHHKIDGKLMVMIDITGIEGLQDWISWCNSLSQNQLETKYFIHTS